MVKIRLRRMGQKHRPFYRIVVAKSTAGRGGSFIEVLGTYNPVSKPTAVTLDGEKSLHWLKQGAQPTETVAYLLQKEGVLDKFFAERPASKKAFRFLDKRTSAMSRKSVVEAAPVEAPKAEAPAAPVEAAPEPQPEPESVAAEPTEAVAAPVEESEPAVEASTAEETQ